MSDHVEITGLVVDSCKGVYRVQVDGGEQIVKAKLSGKMRKNKINVIKGDLVKVKLSVYDLTNGFIVRRLKK